MVFKEIAYKWQNSKPTNRFKCIYAHTQTHMENCMRFGEQLSKDQPNRRQKRYNFDALENSISVVSNQCVKPDTEKPNIWQIDLMAWGREGRDFSLTNWYKPNTPTAFSSNRIRLNRSQAMNGNGSGNANASAKPKGWFRWLLCVFGSRHGKNWNSFSPDNNFPLLLIFTSFCRQIYSFCFGTKITNATYSQTFCQRRSEKSVSSEKPTDRQRETKRERERMNERASETMNGFETCNADSVPIGHAKWMTFCW